MTTSLKLPQTAKLSSEDAARTLGKLLLRARTFESPAIAAVEFPSELARKSAVDALGAYLSTTDDKLIDLDLRQPVKLLDAISELKDNEVASVHGLHAQPEVVGQLNWGRERLTDANKRVVFWLNPEEFKDLIMRAPDFWRFRNRHLVLAPLMDNEPNRNESQIYQHSGLSLSNLSADAKRDRIAALEELLESIENPKSKRAQSLRNAVAHLYWEVGDYKKAIEHSRQALVISREIGDRPREGMQLNNLGNIYSNLSHSQEAIKYYQKALSVSQEIGDIRGESGILGNLGNVHMRLGKFQKAIDYYQHALTINREIGDKRNESRWLDGLGNVYRNLGEIQKAISYLQNALNISQEIGDKSGEGNRLCNLGNAYANLGKTSEAVDYFQKGLMICKRIGDRLGEATCLGNIGNIYVEIGQTTKALEYFQQSLVINREISNRWGEGNNLSSLGLAHNNLGKVQDTIAVWLMSFSIFRTIEAPTQETVIHNLAKLRAREPNFDTLLRNLFPSGDIILNKATGQNYTFYKDAPPDLPDQILELLDKYEKDNPQS